MKKDSWIKKYTLLVLHKVARYTKQQKLFWLFLIGLVFFMLVLPVVKISPADPTVGSRTIFLVSWAFGKTNIILWISVLLLLGRNLSFSIKSLVTTYFGFRDSDALLNFGLLWIITSVYLAIGDTISLFTETTTIQVSKFGYNFILLLLLVGLLLSLWSVVKKAQWQGKTKIVNIVDDEEKKSEAKQTVKWLFGGE